MFYFQVYGNLVDESITYQQLQKVCMEKVCRTKIFRASFGKFGQNVLCTHKKVPALTPVDE